MCVRVMGLSWTEEMVFFLEMDLFYKGEYLWSWFKKNNIFNYFFYVSKSLVSSDILSS